VAICGNHPPECDDVLLSEIDIEWVGLEPEQLIAVLRDSLLFGGTEAIEADRPHVYRAGAYVPTPGIRHTIYFAVRCSDEDYATLFDALRSRHEGQSFAVLIPTDRFLRAETIRQMGSLGISIIPLAGLIDLHQSGRLVSAADPEHLFAHIGQRTVGYDGASPADYAWLRTASGARLITEREYKELLASATDYAVVADQLTQTIDRAKGNSRARRTNVPHAYFSILRKAIEARAPFDPTNPDQVGSDMASAKQIFQRARQAVDIDRRNQAGRTWALFKTVRIDRRALYQFQPDPDVRFALIFAPQA